MSATSSVIVDSSDGDALTTSAIVAEEVTGSHVLVIEGFSLTKGLGNGRFIRSSTFSVGGHRWSIRYYPDGYYRSENADWISLFLEHDRSDDAVDVKASCMFSLLDVDDIGEAIPMYSKQSSTFTSANPCWGFPEFAARKDLEASSCLKDDCLRVRFDVAVLLDIRTVATITPRFVAVPPSDMCQQFGCLLLGQVGADVTFEVAGEMFSAHRCVLAARSPVFMAELFGPMKEKDMDCVQIQDMEARVFDAMLQFIYTGTMPDIVDKADAFVLTQHLLVAADRYGLENLKLFCEHKLCNCIDASTAATTLVLAEQHGCLWLKNACFAFLESASHMKMAMTTEGFDHIMSSCPSLVRELLRVIVVATGGLEQAPSTRTDMSIAATSAAAVGRSSDCEVPTVSAIVAGDVTGSHVLHIKGYSLTKGLGNSKFIKSRTFSVAGHLWYIRYYPDGDGIDNADRISIYLQLDHDDAVDINARFKFSILDDMDELVPLFSHQSPMHNFSPETENWGFNSFIARKALEETSYLTDDCLKIRCDVTVSPVIVLPDLFREECTQFRAVPPPSHMCQQFGCLLVGAVGADVTIDVAGEMISAHSCVLAARSSVFMAELFGPLKEKATECIRIHDMELRVFRAMIHFIYTDTMPDIDNKEDLLVFTQHLLVAAGRYDLERLKLICEDKLCNCINTSTVLTTLTLAERQACHGLKNACFEFLKCSSHLVTVMETEGFDHLLTTCPSLIKELMLAKLAATSP